MGEGVVSKATRAFQIASTQRKNAVLARAARGLREGTAALIEANRGDVEGAIASGLYRQVSM